MNWLLKEVFSISIHHDNKKDFSVQLGEVKFIELHLTQLHTKILL